MPPKSWISFFACGLVSTRGMVEREQIFDQLIIVEAFRAGVEQPLAQPRAMAGRILVIADGALVHSAPT